MSKTGVKDKGDVWYQSGIVSFGSSVGCEVGYPNGFTKVEHYMDWIQEIMGKIA